MSRVLVIVALLAGAAHADGTRLDVPVGHTVEVNVGYARGIVCDDTTVVEADIVTRDDSNIFVVKGLKVGDTTCRVGTDIDRVQHFLFNVHVAQPPAKGHA